MAEKDEKAEVSSEGEVLSDEQREQNTEVCHQGEVLKWQGRMKKFIRFVLKEKKHNTQV